VIAITVTGEHFPQACGRKVYPSMTPATPMSSTTAGSVCSGSGKPTHSRMGIAIGASVFCGVCHRRPRWTSQLWDVPNLLLQKFPAPRFTATLKMTLTALTVEDRAGLLVMGADYAAVIVKKGATGLLLSVTICIGADQGAPRLSLSHRAVEQHCLPPARSLKTP